jgi:hypothetical protein
MSRRRWREAVVAAPGVALAAFLAVALLLSAAGRNPIWPDQQINLSEAIAAEADAEIVRLRGARLDLAYDVRPGLLSERATRATPLESAIRARRADYLDRLLKDGAALDAMTWTHLRCMADGDARVVLERYRPAGGSVDCGDTPRR